MQMKLLTLVLPQIEHQALFCIITFHYSKLTRFLMQVNGIALPVDGGLSSSHPIIVGQSF